MSRTSSACGNSQTLQRNNQESVNSLKDDCCPRSCLATETQHQRNTKLPVPKKLNRLEHTTKNSAGMILLEIF